MLCSQTQQVSTSTAGRHWGAKVVPGSQPSDEQGERKILKVVPIPIDSFNIV